MTPLLYGQFTAYALYRAEIVFRESAILGILGVHTLGFYVENGIAELRFDRAAALIVLGAAINLAIDAGSRRLRGALRVRSAVDCA